METSGGVGAGEGSCMKRPKAALPWTGELSRIEKICQGHTLTSRAEERTQES